jgi:UDP-N-acetylglucosamine 1-carboxyvinyltransferase
MPVIVEGGHPLVGTVSISGAKNSALKVISAALFSNEDVVIDNVPRIQNVLTDIEVVKSIGATVEWMGASRIVINGSNINTYEIPYDIGCRQRTSLLLAGPLLFRFGKAQIPKFKPSSHKPGPINRHLDVWKSLGIEVLEDEKYIYLDGENIKPANINFRTSSHMATDNAILSSLFLNGETVISNASEESEIDDLIESVNLLGATVQRTDPRTIKVTGSTIFKGFKYQIQPDKTEAAVFATAALLTKGNIEIKGVNRETFIPFANFLSRIGARFEFIENGIKVWRHDEILQPTQINITPTPGFVPDWQSLSVLLLTQAEGESLIHDTVYINRFSYTSDLNRMGTEIELVRPSSVELMPVISDDSYDFEKQGEAETVAKILGPKKLKGGRLQIIDFRYGAVLVLAALCAEGKSEIIGIENIEEYFENFVGKLQGLGAKIWSQ